MRRLLLNLVLWACAPYAAPCGGFAQTGDNPPSLRELARQVSQSEENLLLRHDSRLRYRVQRVDEKGSTLRDHIESQEGGVARLLQHNGLPLTPEEDAGERDRLNSLLGTNKLQQHERDYEKNRMHGIELLRAMPDAMHFALAADQAPLPDVSDRQMVLDFQPDPAFRPASLEQQILLSLRGRMWIDLVDHQLLRMELHNTGDVNLAWGLLAKVYAGGNITYDQRRFQDLYVFTHIAVHLRIRELMVRTVAMETDTRAAEFQRLAAVPSANDAVRTLLADAVPTR